MIDDLLIKELTFKISIKYTESMCIIAIIIINDHEA